MQTTDKQVRKLITEYQKTGNKSVSALKAGMSRKTAGKYLAIGKTLLKSIDKNSIEGIRDFNLINLLIFILD